MNIFIGGAVLGAIIFYYIFLWHRRHLIFYLDDNKCPAESLISLFAAFFIWIILMGMVNLAGVMVWLYLWEMVRPDLHIFPLLSYLAEVIAVIVIILDIVNVKYFYSLVKTQNGLEEEEAA